MRMNSLLALAGLSVSAFVPEAWSGTAGAGLVNASVAGVMLLAMAVYSRHQRVEGMVAAAGGALLAFAYLGLMLGFIPMLRREHTVWVLLWVLLTTKSCDIGAFFTGTAIGRHKLIPWLSPGKTWEGLFGGLATSAAVGALGAWGLHAAGVPDTPSIPAGAWAGLLFGGIGQVGDLLASLLKRDARLKDSGRSLPGFGGILDVIDSPVVVMPVAFWWLRAFAPALPAAAL
jgi:phosphatidate cytidylyltransferase